MSKNISEKISVTGKLPTTKRIITIAIPCYRSMITMETMLSIFKLTNDNKNKYIFNLIYIDYADIVTSRNYLLSNFFYNYQSSSHLLFIDNDMGFQPDIIQQMIELKEPVVGVVAPSRTIDFNKLYASKADMMDKAYNQSLRFIGKPPKDSVIHPQNSDFFQTSKCGTGIMLISRNCIVEMINKRPEIVDEKKFKKMVYKDKFPKFLRAFDKIELEDRELSEDLSFCHRWVNDCQGKIYVNIKAKINHVSQITVKGDYSLTI